MEFYVSCNPASPAGAEAFSSPPPNKLDYACCGQHTRVCEPSKEDIPQNHLGGGARL